MCVGGRLNGVVTLTATTDPQVVLVEATWGESYARESISVTRAGERDALTTANAWTDQLVDGRTPTD
jgi:hypothetical protein